MKDGSWPIYDDVSLRAAINALTRHTPSMTFQKQQEIKEHINRRATALGRPLPFAPEEAKEDRWWEDALDKQVSLKTHEECKFCRLTTGSTPTNQVQPWMGTICNRCGRTRMVHRPYHPHIYDGAKRNYGRGVSFNGMKFEESCEGFEEPDFTILQSQLDLILERSSNDDDS